MISYGKQSIDQSDLDSVIEVLKSDWLTQGPAVDKFEEELNNYFGSSYCSVVSNGTAALHLAGLALGWGPDDIIITTPITFLASSNSIIYTGARPEFVDINPKDFTIDVDLLEEKIKKLLSKNKKVKAIIAVDFAGQPCNWIALREIADKFDIKLINDNCHALGASYFDDKKYAIKYADIVTQSFHPVKHITTGEGGAVLTNHSETNDKIKLLRTHGITKSNDKLGKYDGPWYYEMQDLGYNYRITDFQCALGISQLKKLDNFVNKRRDIADVYHRNLSEIDHLSLPFTRSEVKHAYHLYPLQIDFNSQPNSKADFFEKMYQSGINLQVHYIPVHLQPYYQKNYSYKHGDFPIAENFYLNEVSIPIYPNLSESDQQRVIDSIKNNVKF